MKPQLTKKTEPDVKLEFCQVEFKDVWFRYPSNPNIWILKGLNLDINDSESLVLVSRCPKAQAAVVQLLMGFYKPEFGQILVNGRPIFSAEYFRSRTGFVKF